MNFAFVVHDTQARETLKKVSDIAIGDVAEGIRRHDILHIGRVALQRNRFGAAFALTRHGKLAQLINLRRQIHLFRGLLARANFDGNRLHVQTGVRYHQAVGAGRHLIEVKAPFPPAKRRLIQRFEHDPGAFEIRASRKIADLPANAASRLPGGGRPDR